MKKLLVLLAVLAAFATAGATYWGSGAPVQSASSFDGADGWTWGG